jgi:non-ribosomal peptide synthetase component F
MNPAVSSSVLIRSIAVGHVKLYLTEMVSCESRLTQTKFFNPVHRWFEAQVAQTPDSTALISDDRSLTYFTLNQQSNQLGHYLQERGVKPETTVGICLTASPMLAIAVFGILKAGGAYVPIEPSLPPKRMRFMLRDADVSILITEQKNLSAIPSECPRFCV